MKCLGGWFVGFFGHPESDICWKQTPPYEGVCRKCGEYVWDYPKNKGGGQ